MFSQVSACSYFRRGIYLGQGEGYLPCIREAYLPWLGGGGTYLGWGDLPWTEEGIPTLDGGGIPTLNRGRGCLAWIGRGTYLGWGVPTLDRGEGVPTLDGGRGTYLGSGKGVPSLD